MSLAIALNTARSALQTTAAQIASSGGNIANADDPTRSRKIAQQTTSASGAPLVTITRAGDPMLAARLLASKSAAAGSQALADGLDRLHETIGDPADGASPAARVAALSSALQAYANAPSNRSLAQAAVTAAQSLVSTLNSATQTVTTVRSDADAAMAQSVSSLNTLLGQFEGLNNQIVAGSLQGQDVTDALDRRDALLGQISDEIGINVVSRPNNDIAIYTDSGVTLFDKVARTVSFAASGTLTPGSEGAAVIVDGVPVTGGNATMPISSGRLSGLATLRDVTAPAYQGQLDELARGLVESFAESDQSGGGGADLAGLLTWSGGPAIPTTGALSSGIAGSIKVNPAVVPSQGGKHRPDARWRHQRRQLPLQHQRCGGLFRPAERPCRCAGRGAQLRRDRRISAHRRASLDVRHRLRSAGWRTSARPRPTPPITRERCVSQVTTAVSNAAGVNLDDEYALQLQLEQSYQASSKLITLINSIVPDPARHGCLTMRTASISTLSL